ncbi:DUF6053 domain-containing protein [Lysobacter enzymogenes]|uniref:DUF6053 domain-containing protein n=1 Tax=Lysobacter enzymogenes TaxID=69 RepID=UPI003D2F8B1D
MGGPSGPMLLFQVAATWPKSIGPEGPPTVVLATSKRLKRLDFRLPARSLRDRSAVHGL